jgi:hypothetical protein
MAKAGFQAFGSLGVQGIYATQNIVGAINNIRSPIQMATPQNTEPNALINAAYGFGYYTITPNNTQEVNDAIAKIGYTVYLPTNDFRHGLSTTAAAAGGYDTPQFLTCQVSGPFSQDTGAMLEEILMAGFRIYYNANIVNQ